MVYLRFITERVSVESALIRFGTRWWCSHVEFVRTVQGATGDSLPAIDVPIDTLGSRLGDGVQRRPYNYCRPTREEWWTAPGIDAAYAIAETVIESRYDWSDIFGFAFARDWHRPGSYICSALVAAAFFHAGWPLINVWIPIHRVSPRDLLVSRQVTFVKRVL